MIMEKVVISGVTGFIGKALAFRLLEKGVGVLGLGRNAKAISDLYKFPNFEFINMELNGGVNTAGKRYDVFFHLACEGVSGKTKNDYLIQIKNMERSIEALLIAEKLGCRRFVFAGSVDEYEVALSPDTPFRFPTHSWIYGNGKFASENFLKALSLEKNIDYIGALMVLTYGEGNDTNILPNVMIRKAFSDKKIALIEGKNYYDMLYIEDTVNGLICLADIGKGGESYYIGHKKVLTFQDIVLKINDILGLELQLNFGEYQQEGKPLDYRMIDREKLYRDTGFECNYNLEEGLKRTYEWLIKRL